MNPFSPRLHVVEIFDHNGNEASTDCQDIVMTGNPEGPLRESTEEEDCVHSVCERLRADRGPLHTVNVHLEEKFQ